jgi:hypothetical protein
MVKELLRRSEMIFPKLNGVSTASNLVMTIVAYLNRDSPEAAAKLPWLAASFVFCASVTVYTLTIQAPTNNAMRRAADKLKKDSEDTKTQEDLRVLQLRWQNGNIGARLIELFRID